MIDPITGMDVPDAAPPMEWPPRSWLTGGDGSDGIISVLQDGSEPPLRADGMTPELGTVQHYDDADAAQAAAEDRNANAAAMANIPDFAQPQPIPMEDPGAAGVLPQEPPAEPVGQYGAPIGPPVPGYADIEKTQYARQAGPAEPPGLKTPQYLERRYEEAQTPESRDAVTLDYYSRLRNLPPEAQAAAQLLHEQRRDSEYSRGIDSALADRRLEADNAQRDLNRVQARVDSMWGQNLQEAQRLAHTHVDPDHYRKNQGVVGNILDGVASVFGSVLAVHNGGRNTIVEQIQKDIDRDIEAQVQDLNTRRDALHTSNGMVADLMRRGYDQKRAADIATQARFEQRATELAQKRAQFDPAGSTAYALLNQENALRAAAAEKAAKQHQQDFKNHMDAVNAAKDAARRDKYNPGGVGRVGIDPRVDLPYIDFASGGGGGGAGGLKAPTSGLVDPNTITSDSILVPQLDAKGNPVVGPDGKMVMMPGLSFNPKTKGALDVAEKVREAVNSADQANYVISAIDKRGYGRDAFMGVRKALNQADSTTLQMDLANYYKQRSEGDAARLATATGGDLNAMSIKIWEELGPNERKAVVHSFRDRLNRRTERMLGSYNKFAKYDPTRLPPSPDFDEEASNKDLHGYSNSERREGVKNTPVVDPEKGKGLNPAAEPKPGTWPRNAAGDYGTEGDFVEFVDSLTKVDIAEMPGGRLKEKQHAAAEQYIANDRVLRGKELELADLLDPLKNPTQSPEESKKVMGLLKRVRAAREKIRKMAPQLQQTGQLPDEPEKEAD